MIIDIGSVVKLDFSVKFNIEEIASYVEAGVDFEKLYSFGFQYFNLKKVIVKNFVNTSSAQCIMIDDFDLIVPMKMVSAIKEWG